MSHCNDRPLPTGEMSDTHLEERRRHRVLFSGKLLRYDTDGSEPMYCHTSDDGGASWVRGGRLMSYRGPIQGLNNAAVQMASAAHRGRIVLPFYLSLHGKHPDYARPDRGGYARYRGEKILLETHTHVPEMAGSFTVWSDDEGASWNTSEGFMIGFFRDGRMGLTAGDEPALVELSDGRLLCYMRSTCGRIVRSTSDDGGRFWSKVEPTDLAMSNSPCALARVPGSHDIVLIWNQVSAEEIERGYRRGRLSAAVSHDDARTWEHVKTLERVSTLSDRPRVEPPPLTCMVRGPSGPDHGLGDLPDDFRYYGYPEIYFDEDRISICYKQHLPHAPQPMRWRTFPIGWLYE